MDAVEFLKIRKRICTLSRDKCYECPLSSSAGSCLFMTTDKGGENVAVDRVEQWSKEHPVKTRQSEFLKMFPNVGMVEGVVHISPCTIDNSIWENCNKCTRHEKCSDCRRDYWLQEVE